MEQAPFEPVEDATMELRGGYDAAVSIQNELIRYIQHDIPRSAWAATLEGMKSRNALLDKVRELTYPLMPMQRCDRIAAYGKPDPMEASR